VEVNPSAHLSERVFDAFMFCGGIGGGAVGIGEATDEYRGVRARFRIIGSVDVDPVANRAFERIVGVPATTLDLFTRDQYVRFHGHAPPADWHEATGEDIRRAAGYRRPHMVFTSSPCKGLSSLQSSKRADSPKYQALNELVRRTIELIDEAWGDDPPEFILLENVPMLATRGRDLLDDVKELLDNLGYASAETKHDCGELGGLAQHRQRFLLVARHRGKVRPFLWEPPKQRVKGVGEVLGSLPLPDAIGLPMHRLPRLKWLTWVRLALIEAGSDWRSLNRLAVENGYLRDLGIAPVDANWHPTVLGVQRWGDPAGVVTGQARPYTGRFSVADPRCNPEWARHNGGYGTYGVVPWKSPVGTVSGSAEAGSGRFSVADPRPAQGRNDALGVKGWEEPAGTVAGERYPSNGRFAVADPRIERYGDHSGKMRVEGWCAPTHTVTGSDRVGSGALSVADPRLACDVDDAQHRRFNNCYRVIDWTHPAQAVTAGAGPSAGGQAVADPRVASKSEIGDYASARHYGVLRWGDASPAVTGSACHDNGAHSVADVRLPLPNEKGAPLIIALDGTWHRPFTTMELAALQGFDVLNGFELEGADSLQREHIGNCVPRLTALAIGRTMLRSLLMHSLGESFVLRAEPVWVHPLAIGLSVAP
jgi:site-specific DNA-cytosine methylase